jgi:hypothetical protein
LKFNRTDILAMGTLAILETGVWTSNQLISFDVYGAALNARRQRGIAAGLPGFRPNLLPMSVGPVPVGGLAVFTLARRVFRVSDLTAVTSL